MYSLHNMNILSLEEQTNSPKREHEREPTRQEECVGHGTGDPGRVLGARDVGHLSYL